MLELFDKYKASNRITEAILVGRNLFNREPANEAMAIVGTVAIASPRGEGGDVDVPFPLWYKFQTYTIFRRDKQVSITRKSSKEV